MTNDLIIKKKIIIKNCIFKHNWCKTLIFNFSVWYRRVESARETHVILQTIALSGATREHTKIYQTPFELKLKKLKIWILVVFGFEIISLVDEN